MNEGDIEKFLSHLAVSCEVAPATQNQALGALLFLFRDVLRIRLDWLDDVVRAKKPKRLPVVLTRQEVQTVMPQESPGRDPAAARRRFEERWRLR